MTCNCQSYNRPDLGGSTPPMILRPGNYFNYVDKEKTICVDACIANEVINLWLAGIETRGSCCGHNGAFTRSIIIEDLARRQEALSIVDDDTKIGAWELIWS